MKIVKLVLPALALGFSTVSVSAATSYWQFDAANTIPGTVANALIADGEGDDWTGAVLKIDLTSGSIYNDPTADSLQTQGTFWGFLPELQWDSAVGIAFDGSTGIAGGAGDLGGGPHRLGGTGVDAASITWFNTSTNDTSAVQIANVTMTNDAFGTWQLITSFANGPIRSGGIIINGRIPEPATLSLMGLGGLAVLRRR